MTSQEVKLQILGTEKYELPLLLSRQQVVLKLNWRTECESWFITCLKNHPKLRYFLLLPSLALPSKSMGELREWTGWPPSAECQGCTIAGSVI